MKRAAGTELAVAKQSLQPWGQLGQPLMQVWAEEVVCDPLFSLGLL